MPGPNRRILEGHAKFRRHTAQHRGLEDTLGPDNRGPKSRFRFTFRPSVGKRATSELVSESCAPVNSCGYSLREGLHVVQLDRECR